MTARLVAVWPTPDDVEAFEAHYFDVHMPLARRMPGMVADRITRVGTVAAGDGNPRIVTILEWDDTDTMQAALDSPEGAATMEDLGTVQEQFGIAPDIYLGAAP